MELRIKIDMENAAFEDNGRGHETARILRELAASFEYNGVNGGDNDKLRDANGNTVGRFEVVGE